MTDNLKFGQFISEKRIERSMNKKELSGEIGISIAYLSQIESGTRSNPSVEILNRIVEKLALSTADTYKLYDLYAAANNTISPDVSEYIKKNEIILKVIRTARESNADEQDWIMVIDQLKK